MAILLVCLGWLVLQTIDIWAVFFIAYIIMTGFIPVVGWLRRRRVPTALAIALPYLVTLTIIAMIILPILPLFVGQVSSLLVNFPSYLNKAARFLHLKVEDNQFQNFLTGELNGIGQNLLSFTGQLFSAFFAVLTLFVISFYLLLDHDRIRSTVSRLFPTRYREYISTVILQSELKLGAWLRGQLILSATIGIMTWLGLTVTGMKYALPLALIAAVGEIIPTVGPILSAVPAVIIALGISPTMAGIVIIMYLVIQTVENHVLVPTVMRHAVGLHPLFTILAILIGSKLMGVLGAVLAVPFLTLATVFVSNLNRDTDS